MKKKTLKKTLLSLILYLFEINNSFSGDLNFLDNLPVNDVNDVFKASIISDQDNINLKSLQINSFSKKLNLTYSLRLNKNEEKPFFKNQFIDQNTSKINLTLSNFSLTPNNNYFKPSIFFSSYYLPNSSYNCFESENIIFTKKNICNNTNKNIVVLKNDAVNAKAFSSGIGFKLDKSFTNFNNKRSFSLNYGMHLIDYKIVQDRKLDSLNTLEKVIFGNDRKLNNILSLNYSWVAGFSENLAAGFQFSSYITSNKTLNDGFSYKDRNNILKLYLLHKFYERNFISFETNFFQNSKVGSNPLMVSSKRGIKNNDKFNFVISYGIINFEEQKKPTDFDISILKRIQNKNNKKKPKKFKNKHEKSEISAENDNIIGFALAYAANYDEGLNLDGFKF